MRFDDNRKVSRVLIAAGMLAYVIWAYLFLLRIPQIASLISTQSLPPDAVNKAFVRLYTILLCLMETAGLLLAAAIGLYIAICRRIGSGRSFCRENAGDLNRIAVLLLIAGALFVSVRFFTGYGFTVLLVVVVGLIVAGVSVLAWGLGKLVLHAVAIKEENDLTI